MWVTTRAEYIWDESKKRYVLVAQEGFEHAGPIALLKKGRKRKSKILDKQMEIMNENQRIQREERAKAEPTVRGWEATKPGELSPVAQSQYGRDLNEISRVYSGLREVGLRMANARGMGRSPNVISSILNTALERQGRDETEAYRRGMDRTDEQSVRAVNYRAGQQAQYNPLPASQAASNSASELNKMGSIWSDIGRGVSTIAGTVVPAIGAAKSAWGILKGAATPASNAAGWKS